MEDKTAPDFRKHATLADIKGKTLKPVDAWWTVLVIDPIAIRLLWVLIRVFPRATPHAVTSASLALGALSSCFYYMGFFVWGALFFQLAFVMDCIDGKLGRLKNTASPLGGFWDGFAGDLVYGINLIAIILSRRIGFRPEILLLGIFMLFLRALSNYTNLYIKRPEKGVHAPFTPATDSWLRRHRLLAPMTFPDRHAILFVFGPLTGMLVQSMILVASMELAILLLKVRKIVKDLPGVDNREAR
jgi:phosphatidylglycerophosphate synthase